MRWLVELDPDVCPFPKTEGLEYTYCISEQLPNVCPVQNEPKLIRISKSTSSVDPAVHIELNIMQGKHYQLQQADHFLKNVEADATATLQSGNLIFT